MLDPDVMPSGKVSTMLADLDGVGVEYYLRPNGDIIKFVDGRFANVSQPICVNKVCDDSKTLLIA